MQPAIESKPLLREPSVPAAAAQVLGELLERFHGDDSGGRLVKCCLTYGQAFETDSQSLRSRGFVCCGGSKRGYFVLNEDGATRTGGRLSHITTR
jgi:hypothetical protein